MTEQRKMDEHTKQLIKSISSSYIRAMQADDPTDELKHLIFAVHDITDLLLLYFDGRIDVARAKSYTESIAASTNRIDELIGEMQHEI